MKRRLLCLLLALLLCVGLLPMAALAASEEPAEETVEGGSAEIAAAETAPATQPEEAAEETTDTQSAEENLTAAALDGNDEGTMITVGESVTSTADDQVYFINLTAGLYYIRTEGGNFTFLPPNAAADQGVEKTGGALCANESGNYKITVSDASTTFMIVGVKDATDAEVSTVTTGITADVDREMVYKLGEGTYSVSYSEMDVYATVYTTEGRDDKSLMNRILVVPAGKTYWLLLRPNGVGNNRGFTVTKALDFALDTETAVSNGCYRANLTEGLYVLESSGCSASYAFAAGIGNLFTNDGKQYIASTNSASLVVNVTGAAQNATIKVRALTDSDTTAMTAGTDGAYTVSGSDGSKLYRFVAPEAGYYTVTTNGASVHSASGERMRNSYATLAKDEVLYVAISQASASCTIRKGEIKTLTCGQTITVNSDDGTLCYQFTAPDSAVYCFSADGVNMTTSLGQGYTYALGWTGGQINNYCYIELAAEQTVYFYIGGGNQGGPDQSASGTKTVKFGTMEQMHKTMTVGVQETPDSAHQGYAFTPEADGVYTIEAPGDGTFLKMMDLESLEYKNFDNPTTYCELESGKTYYLSIPQTRTLKISSMTSSATALTLGTTTTTEADAAAYSYEVTESGFYTLTCVEVASVSQYDAISGIGELMKPQGVGGNNQSNEPATSQPDVYTVALTEGTTVYFMLQKRGTYQMPGGNAQISKSESMSVTLSKLEEGSNKQTITTGTYEQGIDIGIGMYYFTAEKSGMYVLSGARASVMATDNANIKKGTDVLPVLFYLEEGQSAYINVEGVSRALELYLLGDESSSLTLKALEEGKGETLATNTIFSFTAETDGLYLVEVPEGGGALDFVHFLDNHMRQRMMIQNRVHRSYVCNLEAGETVYVFGESRIKGGDTPMTPPEGGAEMDEPEDNKNATVRVTNVSVAQALDAIDYDQTRGLNAADTREAVQELGADYLTEALNSDEGATVADKMAAVESSVDDSTVTTNKAENAGVASVTIVGALLNNLTGAERKVTLTVEADSEKRTLPEELDAESAVYLTMDLDGVASTDDLAVPVCITIAVPADMDARSVRLVHYGADNKTELLEPINVYEDGGVWYARFAVGGFSPFALAETIDKTDDGKTDAGKTDDTKSDDTKSDGVAGNGKTDTGSKAPKTGDESNLALWAFVLLAACGGALVLMRRKREN